MRTPQPAGESAVQAPRQQMPREPLSRLALRQPIPADHGAPAARNSERSQQRLRERLGLVRDDAPPGFSHLLKKTLYIHEKPLNAEDITTAVIGNTTIFLS